MQSRPSHPHTISILGTAVRHSLCITVYPCVLLTVVITVYYTKKYLFVKKILEKPSGGYSQYRLTKSEMGGYTAYPIFWPL